MKHWITVFLMGALLAGVVFVATSRLGRMPHPAGGGSRWVASDHAGILTGTGSPPKEAKIEEAGGKIKVQVKDREISGGGLQVGIAAGAEFDAEPKWFVAFDRNDLLHYGIYPKWVNRIDRKETGYAVKTLSGSDRDDALAEIAKSLGW